ncbi:hypothetical protein [Sphaerisporangium sp. NPDC051011]|uniref:hypothetical protein n=1 Tax=Sphaerisporangium sp. NPDC051011 TaxID=3155792 RepID=UPI0033C0B60F
MMSTGYPIVEERSLPAVPRKWLRPGRRDPADLPEQRPGTVLVFEVNGGYQAFTERRHLRGSEDAVVCAVAVSVVEVRSRFVTATVTIPSCDLAHEFPVQATFRCIVTEPQTVVADGLRDVAAVLTHHLRDDLKLQKMGMDSKIEQIHLLRPQVIARVKAYLEFFPPRIDGMSVLLSGVDVLLPSDVRAHARGVKGILRSEELLELRGAVEDKDVTRLERILRRGTAAGLALGVSRREISVGSSVSMQATAEAERNRNIVEWLQQLPEGALDFLPIDTHVLIQTLQRSYTGIDASPPADPPRLDAGDRRELGGHEGPRPLGLEEWDD